MFWLAVFARITTFFDQRPHQRHVIPVRFEHALAWGHAQATTSVARGDASPPTAAPVPAPDDTMRQDIKSHIDVLFGASSWCRCSCSVTIDFPCLARSQIHAADVRVRPYARDLSPPNINVQGDPSPLLGSLDRDTALDCVILRLRPFCQPVVYYWTTVVDGYCSHS